MSHKIGLVLIPENLEPKKGYSLNRKQMGKLSLLQNQMKKLAWEIMSLERNSYLMLFNQQVSLSCKYAQFG